ncbi:MAG: YcnI family protein, partial [Cellulomonas sp.]|nr:YcnI family protein [Cellulomonas sp.]
MSVRRLGATVLAAVALLIVPTAAASAHVRVIPDASSADGFAKLTFRVPNESATAGTVKVEVAFPTDTPFIAVTYLPVTGWTVEVVEADLPVPVEVSGATLTRAPASVVWTADPGVQIAPGAVEEFSVVAGPLPDPGTEIVLPATQTYSDGDVVR